VKPLAIHDDHQILKMQSNILLNNSDTARTYFKGILALDNYCYAIDYRNVTSGKTLF